MPNYSQGTKLTLASNEEPPYLTVGTDVSAKYKGAFCEAKIIEVNKHVKLRVLFEGTSGSYLIDDSYLKAGTPIETGQRIETRHPEKRQKTYVPATITKILDHSRYTVVFDDGDQCVLRRNSICLKSGKHFAKSETLDQLPLTNPEHFGNPVKVGSIEQLNNSNNNPQQANDLLASATKSPNNNHQSLAEETKSRGKSSSSITTTNSSSTTSEDTNIRASDLNNSKNKVKSRKRQLKNQDTSNSVKKVKKERNASNSVHSSTTNTNSATTPAGRRGAPKGRKRRESINNSSKHAADLDDDSTDSNPDPSEANLTETNVKFELIKIGVKLMVQYGKGDAQNVYEAKVNRIETNSAGRTRYFVHYTGWNNRYDEWITRNRILSIVTDKENGSREGRSKQSENVSVGADATTGPSTTTEASSLTTAPVVTATTATTATTQPSTPTDTSSLATAAVVTSTAATTTATLTTATTVAPTTTTTAKTTTRLSTPTDTSSLATPAAVTATTTTTTTTATAKPSSPADTSSLATTTTTTTTTTVVKATTATTGPSVSTETSSLAKATAEVTATTSTAGPSISTETSSLTTTAVVTATTSTTTTPTTTVAAKTTTSSVKASIDAKDKDRKEKKGDIPSKTRRQNNNGRPTRPIYRFCEEIDESDCDKKISILRERIIALRQTYISLKTELSDLDRRRKRPRSELVIPIMNE